MALIAFLNGGRLYLEYTICYAEVLAGIIFDGIVISDSFLTPRRDSWAAYQEAIASILRTIRKACDKKYLFVSIGGGGFSYGGFGDLAVSVAKIAGSSAVDFFWFAMGNDVYTYPDRVCIDTLVQKIVGYMASVKPYVRRQKLVFGGSSAIWQYRARYSSQYCNSYDVAVTRVVEGVQALGYTACFGNGHLEGMKLVDRIGHVDWSDQVSCSIVCLYMMYLAEGFRRSRL